MAINQATTPRAMDENASLILTALAQGASQAAVDVALEAHALDPASHAEALRHQLQAASLVDDPPAAPRSWATSTEHGVGSNRRPEPDRP